MNRPKEEERLPAINREAVFFRLAKVATLEPFCGEKIFFVPQKVLILLAFLFLNFGITTLTF